jgi:hypothetical protein
MCRMQSWHVAVSETRRIGGGTIQSHSPAVNSKSDATRRGRGDRIHSETGHRWVVQQDKGIELPSESWTGIGAVAGFGSLVLLIP